jgi:hypothetical protein
MAATPPRRLQVQGLHGRQKRHVTPQIKREFKRWAAIEPSSVTPSKSTAWAAIISPVQPAMPSMPCSTVDGYNFRRLLGSLQFLLFGILLALGVIAQIKSA